MTCIAALAASLLVAPCEPLAAPILELSLPASPRPVAARRMSNPELSRIRGGSRYLATRGADGIVRLFQDAGLRDMTLAAPIPTQIPDAWWAEVGAAYIAASIAASR